MTNTCVQDVFVKQARIKLPPRKQQGKEAEYEGIVYRLCYYEKIRTMSSGLLMCLEATTNHLDLWCESVYQCSGL